VIHRRVRLFAAALIAVTAASGPARAQSSPPRAAPGPSVSGQVTGALEAGSPLTIGIDATMPGGWESFGLVEASVISGDQELDHLRFNIENNKLTVGDQDIAVGTGAVATGEYLRVSGAEVVVTTGGAHLSFRVNADVVKAIPGDARFVLSVTDDFGAMAKASRRLAEPEGGGLTWGNVATAVLLALLAGVFVGNVFATRRRPPARLSVYGSIQQRIDQERADVREPSG
jgi:hypothetical protein